jgi:glycosyltransferase involved in cell wall biosynthesis
MYFDINGCATAFGPVVRELPTFLSLFEEIVWIGYMDKSNYGDGVMLEVPNNVKLIPLKSVGGKSPLDKFFVLLALPKMLYVIIKEMNVVNVIHTRGPSVPAMIGAFFSMVFKSKVWWHKYAGNWNETRPPITYGIHRFLLKKLIYTRVTINGFWPNQPKHCISFENPCLSIEQIQNGKQILKQKKYRAPYNFVFIGRLEDEKGVRLILETLQKIDSHFINSLVIIGDGPKRLDYERIGSYQKHVKFLGGLNNKSIHEILFTADFLLLPSVASEGFPKVIAEAACYGVIPIVSDVGSIAHYINEGNGFVCNTYNIKDSFELQLKNAIGTESSKLQQKSMLVSEIAGLFTFDAYREKLEKHIF